MATRKTAGQPGASQNTSDSEQNSNETDSGRKAPARKSPAKKAATKGSAVAKQPAKKPTGGRVDGGGAAAKLSRGKAPDLTKDLRDFASGRPQGWSHDDWESFLGHLSRRGHDTSNADAIGLALERERLALALQQVDGLKPQQVKSLANRFTTIWSLRNAEVEDIEAAAKLPRNMAERIKRSVQPQ
ncbi:hypothetical protein BH23GEM6_BH23GEM6_14510 [soil metagenome]